MDNNQNNGMAVKRPRKLGWAFALSTAGLGALTATDAFNDATAWTVMLGIATGVSVPVTAYVLFAEGMQA